MLLPFILGHSLDGVPLGIFVHNDIYRVVINIIGGRDSLIHDCRLGRSLVVEVLVILVCGCC